MVPGGPRCSPTHHGQVERGCVPNLPKCQVPVLRSCRTYRVSGIRVDFVPTFPKCRVPVPKQYGIEFVPNHFGRVNTLGRVKTLGMREIPPVYSIIPEPKCRVPVLRSYQTYSSVGVPVLRSYRTYRSSHQTLAECSVGYCGRTEHSGKVRSGIYGAITPGILWFVP